MGQTSGSSPEPGTPEFEAAVDTVDKALKGGPCLYHDGTAVGRVGSVSAIASSASFVLNDVGPVVERWAEEQFKRGFKLDLMLQEHDYENIYLQGAILVRLVRHTQWSSTLYLVCDSYTVRGE